MNDYSFAEGLAQIEEMEAQERLEASRANSDLVYPYATLKNGALRPLYLVSEDLDLDMLIAQASKAKHIRQTIGSRDFSVVYKESSRFHPLGESSGSLQSKRGTCYWIEHLQDGSKALACELHFSLAWVKSSHLCSPSNFVYEMDAESQLYYEWAYSIVDAMGFKAGTRRYDSAMFYGNIIWGLIQDFRVNAKYLNMDLWPKAIALLTSKYSKSKQGFWSIEAFPNDLIVTSRRALDTPELAATMPAPSDFDNQWLEKKTIRRARAIKKLIAQKTGFAKVNTQETFLHQLG